LQAYLLKNIPLPISHSAYYSPPGEELHHPFNQLIGIYSSLYTQGGGSMQKGGEWLENWPGQNLTQPEPIAIKEIHVKEGT
jgi:hypothetical protein